MDSTGGLRVSLLMGRWSFWLRVPSLRYLGRNHTSSPGLFIPFLLISQTLLCVWSSALLRSASFYTRVSSGVCRLICPTHPPAPSTPFFSFRPFLGDGEGVENRKDRNTPGVISHFPQYLLGLPFLLAIIQGIPVRVDLRLLVVAVRYGIWLARVLPPALRTWGELFLWCLEAGVSGRAATGDISQPGRGPG